MSWGIAETASDFEKLRAESADYLGGLNSCGLIDYDTYSQAFDFYMDLLQKMYDLGKKKKNAKNINGFRALTNFPIKKRQHIGYAPILDISASADGRIIFMDLALSEIGGNGTYLIYHNTVMWLHGVS